MSIPGTAGNEVETALNMIIEERINHNSRTSLQQNGKHTTKVSGILES